MTGWRTGHGMWIRSTAPAFAARTRARGGFSIFKAVLGTAFLAITLAAIFSAGTRQGERPGGNPENAGHAADHASSPSRPAATITSKPESGEIAPAALAENAAKPEKSLVDDPDVVVRALHSYRETGKLQTLRDSLLQSAERDPAAALASLSDLPLSDRLKIDIGGEILGHWTDRAPREAAAWAEQNRWPGELGGPVAKVAEEWARRDPAAALLWAAGLETGLDQIAALIAATSRWSKTDLHAVAGHVSSQLRGLPRDVMAGTLAREFGQEDPAAGLQWALAVDDPTGRERAAAGAIADLHARDPAQAAGLLQSAGLTPDFRQAVEKRVAGPLPWWH